MFDDFWFQILCSHSQIYPNSILSILIRFEEPMHFALVENKKAVTFSVVSVLWDKRVAILDCTILHASNILQRQGHMSSQRRLQR